MGWAETTEWCGAVSGKYNTELCSKRCTASRNPDRHNFSGE